MKSLFGKRDLLKLHLAGMMSLGLCGWSWADSTATVSTQLAETTLVGDESDAWEVLAGQNQISSDELEKRDASDFEDIFKNTLSVRAGGGRSQSQDVFIQGVQTTMATVTIDGAPQSGLIFYHAGSGGTVEPELLKTVEVSAGTSNALSGPGALGGTLAYETKDGFDLLRKDQNFGAQLKETTYFSADNGYKMSAMGFGLLLKGWSYLVSANYADVGNYTDGKGDEVIDTKYVRKNAFAKISGYLSDSQKMDFSYETIEDEGAGGARFNVYSDEASELANYKKRDTFTVHYDIDPLNNDLVAVQSSAYFTKRTLEGSGEINGIESYGWDVRNTSLFSNGMWKVAYGVDYQRNANTSSLYSKDEIGEILGFYTQADWEINNRWLLSVGSRYDQYDLDPRNGAGVSHEGWSPNATVNYVVGGGFKLHATYAEAFRGATPIMSKLSTATTDPDIQPETARNLDVGLEYSRNQYYASLKWFKTAIDDIINPSPRNVARTNFGDLESTGYELSVGIKTRSLNVMIGVMDADPEITGVDGSVFDEYVSVNNKTGRVWMGTVDYTFESIGVSLGWYTEYVESTLAVGNRSTREKSSTLVHDTYIRWEPKSQKLDGLSVNFSVGNVFDKAYYDQTTFAYQSGYAAPGRDVRLSLSYLF